MFLFFPFALFLMDIIFKKSLELSFAACKLRGTLPVLFSLAVSKDRVLQNGGGGRGKRCVTVGVISGDAVHHFVNERFSAAVSPTSCL